jgi:imidazolonepropionase
MNLLPTDGPIPDSALEVRSNAWVRIENGHIDGVGYYDELYMPKFKTVQTKTPQVLLPGFIDAHTHLCYAGNRAADYALRLAGKSYKDVAEAGGGILSTVRQTRAAPKRQLVDLLKGRVEVAVSRGVTTCEVKSGYGLNVEDEIKLLEAIAEVNAKGPIDLVPTCLAAHTLPQEYTSAPDYLNVIATQLLPVVKEKGLAKRVDIFVDDGGFSAADAKHYLKIAKELGFSVVLHADQFKRGGAHLAAQLKAVSADHLEVATEKDLADLKAAEVIPVALPGASLGLGIPFAPARKILDLGLPLAIASDWNPGTAPMGNLLAEAAILGAAEKLTSAETFAALTVRAARALQLIDRGRIAPGYLADMVAFPCSDWREILYNQGMMLPSHVYTSRSLKRGMV